MIQVSRALHHVRSLPGMGPILAAVVVTEIDTIERFPSRAEALWICWALSLDEQQWRQDLPGQTAAPMQQMAALGFC